MAGQVTEAEVDDQAAWAAQHAAVVAEQGYTILEGVIEVDLLDAIAEDLVRLERELGVEPATNAFEGDRTVRIYNLLVHGELYHRVPVHPRVLPVVEGVLDRGLPHLVAVVHLDRPGRDAPADPRRRPAHPPAQAPPARGVQHDVGHHRLHRGQRGHAPRPRLAPRRSRSGPLRRARDDPRRDGPRQRAGVGRLPVARRRRQRHGPAPGRPRHELLRRLPPPAGEPAARASPATWPRTFSPRLRQLVGYGVYRGLIGHIDKRSPVDLLDEGPAQRMVWDA